MPRSWTYQSCSLPQGRGPNRSGRPVGLADDAVNFLLLKAPDDRVAASLEQLQQLKGAVDAHCPLVDTSNRRHLLIEVGPGRALVKNDSTFEGTAARQALSQ